LLGRITLVAGKRKFLTSGSSITPASWNSLKKAPGESIAEIDREKVHREFS